MPKSQRNYRDYLAVDVNLYLTKTCSRLFCDRLNYQPRQSRSAKRWKSLVLPHSNARLQCHPETSITSLPQNGEYSNTELSLPEKRITIYIIGTRLVRSVEMR